MSISLSFPITGSAQTGFTSPTYSGVTDSAPNSSSKQWAINALGGTQNGVTVHTVSSPFTLTFFRPSVMKQLGSVNPTTGVITSVPRNTYKLIVRKGMLPAANQPSQVGLIRCEFEVPAGAETFKHAEVRAMTSCFIGVLNQLSAGLGDTLVDGLL